MIKRSFLGFRAPTLHYNMTKGAVQDLGVPKRVVLMLMESQNGHAAKGLKIGDQVKTGQRLSRTPDSQDYVIASVSGTIAALAPYVDGYGRKFTAITIDAKDTDEWDNGFDKSETLATALRYFQGAPGAPPLKALADPEKTIRTLVVAGIDQDVLLTTNQQVLQGQAEDVKIGIQTLKKIAGLEQTLIVCPEAMVQQARGTGADVKTLSTAYPSGLPHMVMKDALGKIVEAGDAPEDGGVLFLSAEAAAAIGAAYRTGRLPVTKILTVAGKDGVTKMVKARIGTPVKDVLRACSISADERDRLILGGPLRGAAAYSEELPIEPGTDGIVVQTQAQSAQVTDYPCINCGECVRICPVNIPVNMLIRFLESRRYEDARALYDLDCCIECGLCTYVCISRIPIFQYIKLGKYELSLRETAEAKK